MQAMFYLRIKQTLKMWIKVNIINYTSAALYYEYLLSILLSYDRKCIPMINNILGHCPDFAVILVHHHRQILVNICGTRMIPTPHMSDVFMDLLADSTEFLDGKAHRGMALGSNNIYERCKDAILSGKLTL